MEPWFVGYTFDVTASYSQAFLIAAATSVITIVIISLFRKDNKKLGAIA